MALKLEIRRLGSPYEHLEPVSISATHMVLYAPSEAVLSRVSIRDGSVEERLQLPTRARRVEPIPGGFLAIGQDGIEYIPETLSGSRTIRGARGSHLGDGVFAESHSAGLRVGRVRAEDGTWSTCYDHDASYPQQVLCEGTVLVGRFDSGVVAIDAGSGAVRWRAEISEALRTPPGPIETIDGPDGDESFDPTNFCLHAGGGRVLLPDPRSKQTRVLEIDPALGSMRVRCEVPGYACETLASSEAGLLVQSLLDRRDLLTWVAADNDRAVTFGFPTDEARTRLLFAHASFLGYVAVDAVSLRVGVFVEHEGEIAVSEAPLPCEPKAHVQRAVCTSTHIAVGGIGGTFVLETEPLLSSPGALPIVTQPAGAPGPRMVRPVRALKKL